MRKSIPCLQNERRHRCIQFICISAIHTHFIDWILWAFKKQSKIPVFVIATRNSLPILTSNTSSCFHPKVGRRISSKPIVHCGTFGVIIYVWNSCDRCSTLEKNSRIGCVWMGDLLWLPKKIRFTKKVTLRVFVILSKTSPTTLIFAIGTFIGSATYL